MTDPYFFYQHMIDIIPALRQRRSGRSGGKPKQIDIADADAEHLQIFVEKVGSGRMGAFVGICGSFVSHL